MRRYLRVYVALCMLQVIITAYGIYLMTFFVQVLDGTLLSSPLYNKRKNTFNCKEY